MRLLSATLCALLAASADEPRRHASGDADAGLPLATATWAPYDADPAHPFNRIFRRAFLVDVAPAVVGAALPREKTDAPLTEGWMLAWRDGTPADARHFGGDGRQLPRDGFGAEEAEALRADLAAISDEDVATLRARPALSVLFQHDLLRIAQRLDDTGENPELLPALLAGARRVALPRAELDALAAPVPTRGAAAESAAARAYAARSTEFREVLRRSTRLFDASRTLLWSRLYLAHPDGPEALSRLVDAARGGAVVDAPVGLRGLLVQGIVALDDSGAPVATPLVVELRLQTLANRAGLAADNPTTSRDGVDFSMLQLEREGLRRAGDKPAYRIVDDDDQDLFRDYGTLKHTTYRAQCALCHRTTKTPEPQLGGFPVLRQHAEPRFAVSGVERQRLAEDQVAAWLTGLTQR